MLVIPVVGAIAVLLIAWLTARFMLTKEERGLLTVAARPETCTLQLWLIMLIYPSVARLALTPFDCIEVGERRLLRSDPAVACDDDHWYVLAALGGVATTLYSFGFPLLFGVLAYAGSRAPAEREQGQDSGASRNAARARLLLRSYDDKYW